MIVIRLMEEGERTRVQSFVNHAMRERYGCDAHVLPAHVFLALRGDTLVGSASMSISSGDRMPFEAIYDVDYASFPGDFSREQVVQFGRWVAKAPGLSLSLLLRSVLWAIGRGYTWGVIEVKPGVCRYLHMMGIRTMPLLGTLLRANIPNNVLQYYLSLPPPLLRVVNLRETARGLEKKIDRYF